MTRAGCVFASITTGVLAVAIGWGVVQGATAAGPGVAAGIGLGAGSTLRLDGTSNVHDWEAETRTLTVRFTRDSTSGDPADVEGIDALMRGAGVRGLEVAVPVTSIHSKKEGLEKNLWKDLKSDQFPTIRFTMSRYTVTSRAEHPDTLDLQVEGMLAVAGVEKPATLQARAWRTPQGVRLEGVQPLRMTDFGIKPRTMMMGALRVSDRVSVGYRLLLAPARPETGAAGGGSN